MVERHLGKMDVVGSIPTFGSRYMIIAHRHREADDDGFVRLTNFKQALINLLGLEIVNNDLTEEQLLQIVRDRLEDRNKNND